MFEEPVYQETEAIESYEKLQGPGVKEFITKNCLQ